MSNEKITEEQVVKALCVCLRHYKNCNECPLVDVDDCTILRKYALDLINRLKEENERLYNIKLDLEHQMTQRGLTEYIGADVIEAEARKETAKEILTEWADCDCETGGYNLPYIHELAKQFGVEVK